MGCGGGKEEGLRGLGELTWGTVLVYLVSLKDARIAVKTMACGVVKVGNPGHGPNPKP